MKKLKKITTILCLLMLFGCSTNSDTNGNTTTVVVPIAPSNLTGTAVSTTEVNLSWTDNSTNETGFKIERKTASGTFAVVGTTSTDITVFNDTGLIPNATYIYRVFSNNTAGNSLTYSNELIITIAPTDIDGNSYTTVNICNQTWMQKNLNTTKYSDGTTIPQVTDPTAWSNLTTGAWCYYDNDPANEAVYGKLYNWYAVAGIYNAASAANPGLRKKLAPSGWHLPTDAEWTNLTDCLGGEAVAGGKMKEIGLSHFISPNAFATNSSGFTGLPGGCRNIGGGFNNITGVGYWWSSSENGTLGVWYRSIGTGDGNVFRGNDGNKYFGVSVRCVKD
ncbi:MAG: FISUMP domain-containing protein [Flavobacterium sp.]